MRQGIHFQGIEKYSPYFPNKNYSFIDYMKDCIIFIDEANRIKQRCDTISLEFREYFNQLLENGKVLSGQFDSLFSYEDIIQRIRGKKTVCLDSLIGAAAILFLRKQHMSFNASFPWKAFHVNGRDFRMEKAKIQGLNTFRFKG